MLNSHAVVGFPFLRLQLPSALRDGEAVPRVKPNGHGRGDHPGPVHPVLRHHQGTVLDRTLYSVQKESQLAEARGRGGSPPHGGAD